MKTREKLPNEVGGQYVEVKWNLEDRFDEAGDGHVFMHFATGKSSEGYTFTGTGIVCDGEFTEVEDVEFVDE
jgi:hypothetical protein